MNQKETLFEKLGRALSIAGNMLMMNLLFLLCCLPVVTVGPAWNGLFSAIRYNIRGDKWFAGFRAGFKTRFWRSVLSWVILMIPILLVLESDVIGALLDETGAFRALETFTVDGLVRFGFACLMGLMLTGMLGALTLLNVYIPTSIGDWIHNGANMVFKYLLRAAATGLLMWFPLLMVQLLPTYFYILVMVFVVAYFVLSAFVITMVMKQPLLDTLLAAREDGTLLKEETEEDKEEEEEEEEEENQERPDENG